MMVVLHGNAEHLHERYRFIAEIHITVVGRHTVVSAVQADARLVAVTVAEPLGRLHAVESPLDAARVLRLLEDIILKLDQHIRRVGDIFVAQELLRVPDNVPRILVKRLAFRGDDVAEHMQHLIIAAELEKGGRHIRDRHHIRIVHLRVAVIRGVEADPFLEHLF